MAARDASARFPLNNCWLSFGTADKPKPRAGSGPGQTNVPYAGVYVCAGGETRGKDRQVQQVIMSFSQRGASNSNHLLLPSVAGWKHSHHRVKRVLHPGGPDLTFITQIHN